MAHRTHIVDDSCQIANGSSRRKTRLMTLGDLDRRTRVAARAFELADRLLSERQPAGELRQAITRDVALLCVMIEDAAARWLAGEPIDPSAIATLLNARRRDAELIGIDPELKNVTPDLRTYLAQKAAAPESEAA
jgi:hypothetical protein